MLIEDVPQHLGGGRDDAGAASSTDDGVESSVGERSDDGSDGGKGAFAGTDVVCNGGSKAEFVTDTGNREVVHFVVPGTTWVSRESEKIIIDEFISYKMMPVVGSTISAPKSRLMVVVRDTAMPDLSAAAMCEVPWLSGT